MIGDESDSEGYNIGLSHAWKHDAAEELVGLRCIKYQTILIPSTHTISQ